MRRNRTGWAVVALLILTTSGLVPRAQQPSSPPLPEPDIHLHTVPAAVVAESLSARDRGEDDLEVDLILSASDQIGELQRVVKELGGQMVLTDQTYVRARLPVASAAELPQRVAVVAMGVNEAISQQPASQPLRNQALTAEQAAEAVRVSMESTAAGSVAAARGVTGAGIKVAVIDTGVDPGHPALLSTPSGERKLIDWQDFTGEGDVALPHPVAWADTFTVPGNEVSYRLPLRPEASQQGRFGYWDEAKVQGIINRDLNRNGSQIDRFGVLAVDSSRSGIYDTVYVDTNQNQDFRDEQPLRLFRTSGTVAVLGPLRAVPRAAEQLHFVLAAIDPTGKQVTFGYDGSGHGTWVAGVLGASGDGFTGAAPGVQILALKALRSDQGGNWFPIANAIKYAAENGAKVINLSIGGLAAVTEFEKTSAERLNEIARQYGVLIVLSAGNSGPGLSSGATIGNVSQVLTVGAYYSSAMWKRDYGYVVPGDGVWWESGVGPRADGAYVPSVIAPGGSPTPSPRWRTASGYTTPVGTSIAAPHVSGVAALLMEAARQAGKTDDYTVVKRAIELGARKIPGLGAFEQGYGLVRADGALEYLQRLEAATTIQARSREGKPGFLARSFRPGSTDFSLTNLDSQVSRVGIFSSDSWVRAGVQTLLLPPQVPRRLPLQFFPPNEPGVHASLLTVSTLGKFGPTMTIPVTYVRPISFPQGSDTMRLTDLLEVARYRRYFIDVKPGSAELSGTVRVLQDLGGLPQGTAQVYVFRPDGQMVFKSNPIGAEGDGLSSLFQVTNPIEGTWEVVVLAIPNTEGASLNAGYSLELQLRPGAVPEGLIRLTQAPGSKVTHKVSIQNPFAPFMGRVEGSGLTQEDPSLPWRVVRQGRTLIDDFTLRGWSSHLRVEIGSPVPGNLDLNLYLDRQDASAPGGFARVAQSTTSGSSREAIEITNVPPGRYLVTAIPTGSVRPEAFEYRRMASLEGYQVILEDPVRNRARGDRWNVDVTIQAPSRPGRYRGYLVLRDTEKRITLGWYPILVHVGLPSLTVEPMAPQLTAGRLSSVVLELREASTRKLIDGTVTVNGQRFTSRDGRVVVPVTPQGSLHTLVVEADLPSYQYLLREIRVPVASRWSPRPVGAPASEENADWRRKLLGQLP